MAEPIDGWRSLADALRPGGLMLVGLYSELGRSHIKRLRQEAGVCGVASDDDICSFRARMLDGVFGEDGTKVLNGTDFYTLSACRDLLFHVQEHHFTIGGLEKAMAELELEFLGFDLPPLEREAYERAFPENPAPPDLSRWQEFETAHPRTFRNMYRFWCRKGGNENQSLA